MKFLQLIHDEGSAFGARPGDVCIRAARPERAGPTAAPAAVGDGARHLYQLPSLDPAERRAIKLSLALVLIVAGVGMALVSVAHLASATVALEYAAALRE